MKNKDPMNKDGMPDDKHIISEMVMAYIRGYHWPKEIQNFQSDPNTERGMQNVLALILDKGYTRATLQQPEGWRSIESAPRERDVVFELKYKPGVERLNPPITEKERLFIGKFGTWVSTYDGVFWHELPTLLPPKAHRIKENE